MLHVLCDWPEHCCNLYCFETQLKTIFDFRFLFLKRNESAFCLRSSFIGAETVCLLTYLFSLFGTI